MHRLEVGVAKWGAMAPRDPLGATPMQVGEVPNSLA